MRWAPGFSVGSVRAGDRHFDHVGALAGLDGADPLLLDDHGFFGLDAEKLLAVDIDGFGRSLRRLVPTSDSDSRPVACAWARRATCCGVTATVTVRAMIAPLIVSLVCLWSTATSLTPVSISRVSSPSPGLTEPVQ